METAKSLIILLILALLATTIAQPMAEAPTAPPTTSKPKISETRTASCLVRVTIDSQVIPLSIDTVNDLLESSAVLGKAARQVLGIPPIQGPDTFQITVEQLNRPPAPLGSTTYDPMQKAPPPLPPRPSIQQPSDPRPVKPGTPSKSLEPHADDDHSHSGTGTTVAPPPPKRPNTPPSVRSTSSAGSSSNRQTSYSYGYSRTANTATEPMAATGTATPRLEGILGKEALIDGRWYKVGDEVGDAKVLEIEPTSVKIEWQGAKKTLLVPVKSRTATSRYRSTSNPKSTMTRYGSSSRTRGAYDETDTGGYYGSYYSRGTSTSTGDPYSTGSSSRYSSYYSTRPRTTTTRNTYRSATTPRTTTAPQTVFFRLKVEILDHSLKGAATQLINALIEKLRDVLESAFAEYTAELKSEIEFAENERNLAKAQLAEIVTNTQPKISIPQRADTPENVNVRMQLNEAVGLSALKPAMPFNEALEVIKKSVDPPLNIVVMWRDLYDNAEIEPTTEINMAGPSQISLLNGLSLLLKSVPGGFGEKIAYSIDDGVITIATELSLPRYMVTIVYEIPGLLYSGNSTAELADVIMQTIEPDSWLENEGLGEGKIATYSANKLVIRQTVDVHRKIGSFIEDVIDSGDPPTIPLEIPPETFLTERQQLQRQRQTLEMDIARLKARTAAIEQAVARTSVEINQKLNDDSVTKELEKILEINAKLLEVAKKRYESGTASAAEIQQMEEKLARARIDLAKRREELSLSAGGNELAGFNSQLTAIAIDLAEKTAELHVLNAQLGRTETQLAMATTLNTQIYELRSAKQAFEAAQERLNQLKIKLANLTAPTVKIIGAN